MTTPLEQAINGVEGMQYMHVVERQRRHRARSPSPSTSTRNLDLAAVDVQNRVSQAEGPAAERGEAGRRLGDEGRRRNFVLAAAASTRSNGQYDPLFISNYVDRFVADEIKRVPGVGDVIIFGERKYAMRLWLDPDRLAGRSITADEVVDALREQNVQVAAGQIGAGAGARRADVSDQRARGRPADRAVGVREHHPEAVARTARSSA